MRHKKLKWYETVACMWTDTLDNTERDYAFDHYLRVYRYPTLWKSKLARWTYGPLHFIGVALLNGWCWLFGHDIEDCSSADPESGNMDVECVRCGRYWKHTLY